MPEELLMIRSSMNLKKLKEKAQKLQQWIDRWEYGNKRVGIRSGRTVRRGRQNSS